MGARGRGVASRTRGPGSGAPARSLYPDGLRGVCPVSASPESLKKQVRVWAGVLCNVYRVPKGTDLVFLKNQVKSRDHRSPGL